MGKEKMHNPGYGGGKSQRIIGLDLFRIGLAILVFLFHSHIHVLKCDYGFMNAFIDMGAIAMTGFFLLSGYVMDFTSRRKSFSDLREIKNFYVKRLIAILPLYYAYAVMNIGINVIWKGMNAVIQEVLLFPLEILGLQSAYSDLTPYSHNGGSWFISCILICYFLYPLLYTLTVRLTNQVRACIILILAIILLWSPIIEHYFHLNSIYSNPFLRCLEFSIGILVAQVNTRHTGNKLVLILRNPYSCITTLAILFVGVSIAYHIGIPHDYMLYSWVALPCFISLLFSLGTIRFDGLQKSRIVQYLSALSFSLFLSQLIAVWWIVKYAFDYIDCHNNFLNILVSAVICFGIANFLHYFIEKPSAKYLRVRYL